MIFISKFRHVIGNINQSLSQICCSSFKKSASRYNFLQSIYIRGYSTAGSRPTKRRIWFYAVTSILGGSAIGGGYTYYKLQQARIPISNDGTGITGFILPSKPNTAVSKKITSPTDNLNLQLVLYQYQTCPFCCKVRAYLDYYGFSYDIVEVNPVLRQQMKWSKYRKVPILLAQTDNGYQQLNDSTMIISVLTSYLHDRQLGLSAAVNYYPTISYKDEDGNVKSDIMNKYFLMFQDSIPKGRTKEDLNEERKWRKWADDVLVHMLSPNVYRTREEALQAFSWFSEVGEWEKHFSSWERYLVIYVGAMAMWIIGKRLKKRHNLKDDVRQSLYDECNVLVKQLKKQNTTYLGGNTPNLADLAVYGVLNSIEGCTAFKDMLNNSQIGTWYFSMKKAVNGHTGSAMLGAN